MIGRSPNEDFSFIWCKPTFPGKPVDALAGMKPSDAVLSLCSQAVPSWTPHLCDTQQQQPALSLCSVSVRVTLGHAGPPAHSLQSRNHTQSGLGQQNLPPSLVLSTRLGFLSPNSPAIQEAPEATSEVLGSPPVGRKAQSCF